MCGARLNHQLQGNVRNTEDMEQVPRTLVPLEAVSRWQLGEGDLATPYLGWHMPHYLQEVMAEPIAGMGIERAPGQPERGHRELGLDAHPIDTATGSAGHVKTAGASEVCIGGVVQLTDCKGGPRPIDGPPRRPPVLKAALRRSSACS